MPKSDLGKRTAIVEWTIPLTGLLLAIALCFGIGVLVGSTKADPSTKDQIQAYAAAKARYAQAVAGTLADPIANYSAYPDQNTDECYYADNHDSADLCAQWRAALAAEESAKWTKNGFWVGLGGGILSAIGIVLIFRTLRQGRDALSRAAKANKIARNTARHELRAYLAVTFGGLENVSDYQGVIYSIRIKNAGSTPASNVSLAIDSGIFANGTTVQFGVAPFKQDFTLHPGESLKITGGPSWCMVRGSSQRLVDKNAFVIVLGHVDYVDIFGRFQTTHFSHIYSGSDYSESAGNYHHIGNSAT